VTALVQMLARWHVPGEMAFHNVPESFRMVHLDQMRKFMNDDVIDDVLRCLYQPPVQPDLAFGIAATPLCAGTRQKHLRHGQLHCRGIVRNAIAEVAGGMSSIPVDSGVANSRLAGGIGNSDLQLRLADQKRWHQDSIGDDFQIQVATEKRDLLAVSPALSSRLESGPFVEFSQNPGRGIRHRMPDP